MTSLAADLTRRRLLGLGLLGAGAIVVERVPFASRALAADGGLRARSAVLGLHDAKRIGPVRVPGGFDLAGLKWPHPPGHAQPQIELRARRRGGRWTDWLPVGHAHDHGPDATPANAATDPVWTGRADEVELRLSHGVRGLTLHTVRSDGVRRRIVLARSAQSDAAPAIIPRADWGGDTLKTRGTPQIGSVQMAFVHHTVNANSYTAADSAAIVLAIAKYHINSNGWNDIGYNFLVDRYGQIFEGRAGGIDQAIIGAHAQGFNSYSTGISNIGTYESVAQTDVAINAQARLIAWKLAIHGVSPEGTVDLVSAGGESNRYSEGRTITFQRVSGHRDADKTSCPGDALYAQIPTIRARAIAQDYPVAAIPAEPGGTVGVDQLSIATAAMQVAVYSQVQVTGALLDVDGGPIGGVEVRIQKLGATRWSTAARAMTDREGRFTAPVIVRQNSKLRAYYGGDVAVGGEALTSSEIAVSAIPRLSIDISAKHIGVGRTLTVDVEAKPTRSRVDVVLSKRDRRGRYRTVSRARVRLRGGKGSVGFKMPSAGLYGVVVSLAGRPQGHRGHLTARPRALQPRRRRRRSQAHRRRRRAGVVGRRDDRRDLGGLGGGLPGRAGRHLDTVAAGGLGRIQRAVGGLEQRAVGDVGARSGADAQRHVHLQAARVLGGDAPAQALGHAAALLQVDTREDDQELLPADAVGELERPQLAADRARYVAQHVVAARVAVRVVDLLEVVDVQGDQRDRVAGQPGLLGQLVEARRQRAAVEQAREGVQRRAAGAGCARHASSPRRTRRATTRAAGPPRPAPGRRRTPADRSPPPRPGTARRSRRRTTRRARRTAPPAR